jgi:hypothetical protein
MALVVVGTIEVGMGGVGKTAAEIMILPIGD